MYLLYYIYTGRMGFFSIPDDQSVEIYNNIKYVYYTESKVLFQVELNEIINRT